MKTLCALLLATSLALVSCGEDAPESVQDVESTIAENLSENEELADDAAAIGESLRSEIEDLDTTELSTLFSSLDLVQLDDLTGDDPFTLFAPDDSAFASLDADELTSLLADPDQLRDTLRNHVVTDRLLAADLPSEGTLTSVGGLELEFDMSGDRPTVNGIEIVRTDLSTENGVVHVIDGVLRAD